MEPVQRKALLSNAGAWALLGLGVAALLAGYCVKESVAKPSGWTPVVLWFGLVASAWGLFSLFLHAMPGGPAEPTEPKQRISLEIPAIDIPPFVASLELQGLIVRNPGEARPVLIFTLLLNVNGVGAFEIHGDRPTPSADDALTVEPRTAPMVSLTFLLPQVAEGSPHYVPTNLIDPASLRLRCEDRQTKRRVEIPVPGKGVLDVTPRGRGDR